MGKSIEEIKACFRDAFNKIAPEIAFEKININLPLRDQVEIDSFDFFNIFILLQKSAGVFISDSKLSGLSNLNELINYIYDQSKTQGVLNESKS